MSLLHIGRATVDLTSLAVRRADGEASLTGHEGEVVAFLAEHLGEVVSRETLERDVWKLHPSVRSEAVPVAMRRLRKKLGREALVTVRGRGWKLTPGARPPPAQVAPLPVPPTPLLARDALVASVATQLREGWRWVAVHGAHGVGKTRVVAAVAANWEGTVVAVTRDRADADPLLGQLADALGLVQGGAAAVAQALGDTLLVVDDVIEADHDDLARLLTLCPSARVLTSARIRVPRTEARAVAVPPLPAAAACRLLLDRLPAGTAPNDPHDPVLTELVEAMDGLPGVIELYAGRAVFGAEELLDELSRGVPEALERSLLQSLEGLPADTRDTLWRCAAFGAPFGRDLAGAVLDLRHLTALRDRALLHLDTDRQLFVHATLRRTLRATVPSTERRPAERVVHDHIVATAAAAMESLHTDPDACLERLRQLRPHLLAVIDDGDDSAAREATSMVLEALGITGPASRLREVLDRWRRRSSGVEEPWWRVIVALQVADPIDGVEALAREPRPSCQILVGRAQARGGDTEAALRTFEALCTAWPPDHWAHTRALTLSAADARAELDATEARERLDRACALTRDRFPLLAVQALVASAAEHSLNGDHARALPLLHEGLRIAADLPSVPGAALHLWNGVGLAHARTDTRAALRAYQQSAAIAQRSGSTNLVPVQLNVALSQLVLRRWARAAEVPTVPLRPFPVLWNMAKLCRGAALHGLRRPDDAHMVLLGVDWATLGRGLTGDPAHGDALRCLVDALPAALAGDDDTVRAAWEATATARAHPLGLLARSLADLLVDHERTAIAPNPDRTEPNS